MGTVWCGGINVRGDNGIGFQMTLGILVLNLELQGIVTHLEIENVEKNETVVGDENAVKSDHGGSHERHGKDRCWLD
jgi:hypothetical protein